MPNKKDKLKDMVDAIINDKPEEAEAAFHSYVVDKTKDMIHGEQEDAAPAAEKEKVVDDKGEDADAE